jgi:hypothetical protein
MADRNDLSKPGRSPLTQTAGPDLNKGGCAALTGPARQVHLATLTAFAQTGRAPTRGDLERTARAEGAYPAAVLAELAERDVIAFDQAGEIRAAYPFSPSPTPIQVTWEGGPVTYAMCAIDALGLSAMLGRRSPSPPPSQEPAVSSPSTPTATRPAGTRRGQSYSPEPLAATAVTQRTAPAGTSTSSPAPRPHAVGRTPTPPSPGRSCTERRRCAEASRSWGPSCESGTHGPALTRRDHGKRRPDLGVRTSASATGRATASARRWHALTANRLLPAHSAVPGHAPGRGSRRAHARHRCGHRWPGPDFQ